MPGMSTRRRCKGEVPGQAAGVSTLRMPAAASLIGLRRSPFCRRSIAQLGATEGQLKDLGVQALGIVGTTLENVRLYFKLRPTRLLVADPERERLG